MLSNPLLDRYGPTLDEYLNPNTHGYELQLVTRRVLPSRQDILDAIALLSEPEEVTYQTFETILALEWSPACNNLDILVSGAAQTSLPACFMLITKYCEEGNHRVLDHAYGLLCFRVISLFVQFSIISRSDKLNLLFASNSLQPRGRSIAPEFNEFTCNVISGLVSQSLRNRRFTGMFELGAFGWSVDPSTGNESCFPKLGGCPVDEVHNLFLLLWDSRDKLLYVASRTAPLFPGLGGLICWVWSAIARQFDIDDRRVSESTWAYYLDLLIRFTLCSNEREAQLASLLYFACHKFGTIPVLHFETKNTVDAHDSARIGVETARKLDSDLNLPIDLATALIAYAGPNVDFGGNIVGIMKAAVERLCIELDDVPRAEDLSDSLIAYCEMCFFTLSKVTDHDLRALMQIFILVGEDIFEALGRILFIPISLSEPHSIAMRLLQFLPGIIHSVGTKIGEVYARTSMVPPDEFSIAVVPIWYKVFCYFINRAYYDNRSDIETRYLSNWSEVWVLFGNSVDIPALYPYVKWCEYSRCPAPAEMLRLECSGCHSKRYCSQRCQVADWVLPLQPHQLECGKHRDIKS